MTKPSLPQGTRDFGPDVVRKRQYILNTIRNVFELYGFQPLETPAMENLDTLMGKYGEEGNKLIFKILNNGLDNPNKHTEAREAFEKALEGKNVKELTERALRYDLTIPFARYVAMNHAQLTFPFRRYQVQPVWRADRPARGRYREFYQCDADIVGSKGLLNEVELAIIYQQVFQRLGVEIQIKINNRKILAALAEACGGSDKLVDITVAIDKLDKNGLDKVKEELLTRGLSEHQIDIIAQYLAIDGGNTEKLKKLKELVGSIPAGAQGIDELEFVLSRFNELVLTTHHSPLASSPLAVDLTLARGLDYYTGTIFEVKAINIRMGSIGGGGRYDDLTGLFGIPNIPGIGISFGVDRIYDVLEELKLFPSAVQTGTQVLFFNLGEAESKAAFSLMQQLRDNGIRCELYHEQAKSDKQFKYADKKNINYVIILGSEELNSKKIEIKNIITGKKEKIGFNQVRTYNFARLEKGNKKEINHLEIQEPTTAFVEKMLINSEGKSEIDTLLSFVKLNPSYKKREWIYSKVAFINSVFNTKSISLDKISNHIYNLYNDKNLEELINRGDSNAIALIRKGHGIVNKAGKEYDFVSFASEFCFVHRPDKFPIFDRDIKNLLLEYKKHSLISKSVNTASILTYQKYRETFDNLRVRYNLNSFSYSDLYRSLKYYSKNYLKEESMSNY
jgi:histidyl-tRNA synthetase